MRQSTMLRSRIWLGGTGAEVLRRYGHMTHTVMIYLLSSPLGHMSGLYWLPVSTLAKHTYLRENEARQCLANLTEVGFSKYDESSETVWVIKAAEHQVNGLRNPEDNRHKNIVGSHLRSLPETHLIEEFRRHYGLESQAPYQGRPSHPVPFPSPSLDVKGKLPDPTGRTGTLGKTGGAA